MTCRGIKPPDDNDDDDDDDDDDDIYIDSSSVNNLWGIVSPPLNMSSVKTVKFLIFGGGGVLSF